MRTGAATLLLGAVLLSTGTGSAAQAAVRGRGGELAVRVTVLAAEPRRGTPVEAQVRVTASGAAAKNTMLFLAAGAPARVRVSGICAPAAPGYCGLGEVDAAGRVVPFTIEVPAGSEPLSLGLGAFTWADGRWPAGGHAEVVFAPTPPESTPSPPPSPDPPPPAAPVAEVPDPADPLGLPPVESREPVPVATPETPGPSRPPAVPPSVPPPGASTTLVVAEEPGAGQSVRLGVMLAACVLASALAFRRGARIRRRPEDPGRS